MNAAPFRRCFPLWFGGSCWHVFRVKRDIWSYGDDQGKTLQDVPQHLSSLLNGSLKGKVKLLWSGTAGEITVRSSSISKRRVCLDLSGCSLLSCWMPILISLDHQKHHRGTPPLPVSLPPSPAYPCRPPVWWMRSSAGQAGQLGTHSTPSQPAEMLTLSVDRKSFTVKGMIVHDSLCALVY